MTKMTMAINEAKEELKVLLKKNNVKISAITAKDLRNGAIDLLIQKLKERKRP